MGITSRSAAFAGSPPTLEQIVAQVGKTTGLRVAYTQSPQSKLLVFNAELCFEGFPRERLTVYAYVPGELRVFARQMADYRDAPGVTEAAARNPKIAAILDGWERQATFDDHMKYVHTRGYVGEEGTLHGTVLLALEALGGSIRPPLLDEAWRRDCSVGLTPEMIRERHRRHQRAFVKELLKVPLYRLARVWRRFTAR